MKRVSLAVIVLVSAVALATTIRPLSVEQLTAEASHVVEGQAVASWTSWDADHRILLTYTRFTVTKQLKGASAKEVVVQQLGGTDGVITQKVAGVRHFQTGERTLLFLRPGDTPEGPLVVVGLMQGNFRLHTTGTGQTIASNGVPDTFVLNGSQISDYSGTEAPLNALEARIRKAVGQ